ncbi:MULTISPECIES: hypothetical protein [unclassified Siphonobacter]|uniref:hypothetical protein n=1 Tax=unclassified Siphonobacter TaxID=2635712 RepID=UPI000CAE9D02|nr:MULTISPECIES: hypothetical protein [unclassified Siphonobacter]MDQ1087638.1 hypothetical protein [Siphonobacter sp. SORGH_AS_1065]PKK37958.1 hypothetical protein BWI96_02410 [Siphonobacter sp. SORGH_AS_0500]
MADSVLPTGELIPFKEAEELIARYQKTHPGQLEGFIVGRNIVEQLLAPEGVDTVKILFGEFEDGKVNIVLYPSDKDGNRIPLRNDASAQRGEEDGGDYAADRVGTIPPGKG